VSVYSSAKISETEANYSLDELERLATTAGAKVLGRMLQQRPLPDKSTYLGRGKAEELAALVEEIGVDTVIANETLAPSTRRALEDLVDAKVLDRTALILDIFAQHAKSKAGRAQVELAQLEYLLPRLRGWGQMMSRQGGGQVGGGAGMGSRGPGETQLEVDRRRIHTKIAMLKKKVAKIKKDRLQMRSKRLDSGIPSVAIIGYTNAGKSSLLNALTNSGILVRDELFATLDTTTRRIDHPKYTVTDTVGFIQDLPTSLVEAFRSTLEEATDADLLLHVVDASSPILHKQIDVVNDILRDIRAADDAHKIVFKQRDNEILVYNKCDLLDSSEIDKLQRKAQNDGKIAAFISTMTGDGVEKLLELIEKQLHKVVDYKLHKIIVPYQDGAKLARIYRLGEVNARSDEADGVHISAYLPSNFVV
jgi:GTP-binding protein HflX